MMIKTLRVMGVTTATALVAFGAAASAPQAAAATGDVQVSSDGVNDGSTYSGVLVDDIPFMVPRDSQSEVFSQRNSGTEPGFLRIAFRDVVSWDVDFADADFADADFADALARTGAEFPVPAVVAGGLLLGAGLFLIVAVRRRRTKQ